MPRLLAALVVLAAACDGGDAATAITPPPLECDPPSAEACSMDIGATLPFAFGGTTVGREDGFGGASCGLGGDTIEDMAFRFTAPTADRYTFSTEGSTIDTFLSIRREGCFGREIACNDDANDGTRHSEVTLDLDACATVIVVVDGPSVDSVGAFRLAIHGTEQSCDDGRDDDGDGFIDCDDPDCFGAQCTQTPMGSWPEGWSDIEWEVLEIVNAHRRDGATCVSGEQPPVPPLEMDPTLRSVARAHSEDMLENDYFDHMSLDGRGLADRIAESGFTGPSPYGENILREARDAASAVAGWMSSETGHCENIMSRDYRVIGVGYVENATSTRFTQNFAAGP